ncbi:type I DNA topoisomerase [Psychromonas sp. MB-3u-54]|uniref:type I DNA topoisomerase n=1 Tax=Psychromonas sp. MB-3u-54 TaxID=2058319 RepID=UPI000C3345C8|nr:type I DNA topoisomerase [Psychromonas sp. MB-3u-54]PKH01326.1 type I DNA topoisomerase [Psychromonas sp. MB-3u-54]
MSKFLVIVESPAKAKTINKYLGKDFIVKSSVGHIRDLPTSGSAKKKIEAKGTKSLAGMTAAKKEKEKAKRTQSALVARMGVDPNDHWKANYEILPGKEKVVAELQKLAVDAPIIYLATDLDREGEAIAWHLREVLGGEHQKYKRVVFNEITETAIQDAFEHPTELNIDGVNAQQTRRFLDRVVGFMVSPLLWKKVARGLSAGRVQSVAVRLVVERERLIKVFNPVEFWDLHADVQDKTKSDLRLEVFKEKGKYFKPVTETETLKAVDHLKSAEYKVLSREDKPTKSKPSAPFITSTLQQAASTRLSFGVKKTMMLAQRLYEAGYITYMRTDSTNLSKDAVASARDFIGDEFGQNYLPAEPVVYSSKSGAQEAHEAIRPSDVGQLAALLVGVDRDAQRLYELIWRQFLACQMLPALYDATTLVVQAGDYQLRAKGRTLRFAGWTKVQPVAKTQVDEVQFPELAIGEVLQLVELDPKQHFTKPPARFTEAALVKELEKQGIGRPSTYASIISTIQDRGYVKVDKRRFYAVKMGEIVSDRLSENFVELMSYDFTAQMERNLDAIAEGKANWTEQLDDFYQDLTTLLEKAERTPEEGGMRLNEPVIIKEIHCPTCDREMGIRTASTGVFLGCSGYALPPKERCKTTINLVDGEEVTDLLSSEDLETAALMAKQRCPKCDMAMDSYLVDEKRKLHVCGNNPLCDGHLVEYGEFKIKGYDGPVVECDKCGSDMQLKDGRFGKYMGCTNEECKNTRKILRSGEVAPPKEDPVDLPELECEQSDAHFILRDGASGIFLAANTFPRSRETRAPKVSELARFKDRISPKFYYLAEAPQKDPEGNLAVVRYSRKNKEQYVMTEIEKKATGWTAKYIDGKWVEEQTKKRVVKAKK